VCVCVCVAKIARVQEERETHVVNFMNEYYSFC
jgi:hypothetical protein